MKHNKEDILEMIKVFEAVKDCLECFNHMEPNTGKNQMYICNLINEVSWGHMYVKCMDYLKLHMPRTADNTRFTKHPLWIGNLVWWKSSNAKVFDYATISIRVDFINHLITKLTKELNS